MSVLVAEALSDENGKAKGGKKGDQNNKEIVVRENRKRNYKWDCVLRCTDRNMAEHAAYHAKLIAECKQFGYNQADRWSGPRNIEKVGVDHIKDAEAGDFDCSSLVLECYRLAGLPIKMTGYTGSMEKILMNTGVFDKFEDDNHTESDKYALVGDVYLAKDKHTLIVLEDGEEAEPEPTTDYVQILKGRMWVRKSPNGQKYRTVGVEDNPIPYLGYSKPDSEGKMWWAVDVDNMIGYISSGKTEYAVLVRV